MDLASIGNIDLRKIGLALALGQCEQTLCISGQKNVDMSLVLNSLILFGNAILVVCLDLGIIPTYIHPKHKNQHKHCI
mgnify:CR=1 FL=1